MFVVTEFMSLIELINRLRGLHSILGYSLYCILVTVERDCYGKGTI